MQNCIPWLRGLSRKKRRPAKGREKGAQMASTNKTPYLGLNQWVLDDPFLMEDMNSDNQKLDAAISANPYCKLLDVTTTADAQQINLDLSGIDLTKYAKLELLGNIFLGTYTITSPMNLQVLVPEGGGIRWRPANSSSEYGDRSYVAQYPLSYGNRGTIRLDIMLPINIIDDSYGNYVLFNGSGFCGAYNDKLALDYGGARYKSLSDFKTLAFLSTRTDGKITAGANFVIYGVRR